MEFSIFISIINSMYDQGAIDAKQRAEMIQAFWNRGDK